jgi:hypothetical protein
VLRVRAGVAAGLRRTAVTVTPIDQAPGWDRVQVPLGPLWDTARHLAGHGPDVVVESPADLVEATVTLLTGSLRAMRARTGQAPGPTPDEAPLFDERDSE